VEGECEEKLIKALKEKPSLLIPGKVKRFNVIQNELKTSHLVTFAALPQIPVNPLDYPTRICYNKTNSISKAVTLHDFSEYSEVLSRAT
jgi:hypothetical protein